jgi:hypothetical protein
MFRFVLESLALTLDSGISFLYTISRYYVYVLIGTLADGMLTR